MPFNNIMEHFQLGEVDTARTAESGIAPSDGKGALRLFEGRARIQAIVEFILTNISHQISEQINVIGRFPVHASVNLQDLIQQFQAVHEDAAPISMSDITLIEDGVIAQAE